MGSFMDLENQTLRKASRRKYMKAYLGTALQFLILLVGALAILSTVFRSGAFDFKSRVREPAVQEPAATAISAGPDKGAYRNEHTGSRRQHAGSSARYGGKAISSVPALDEDIPAGAGVSGSDPAPVNAARQSPGTEGHYRSVPNIADPNGSGAAPIIDSPLQKAREARFQEIEDMYPFIPARGVIPVTDEAMDNISSHTTPGPGAGRPDITYNFATGASERIPAAPTMNKPAPQMPFPLPLPLQ